jgi:hypothetical protein
MEDHRPRLPSRATTAAFAPAKQATTSAALNNAVESELGAQPPLGLFDPFGNTLLGRYLTGTVTAPVFRFLE